MIAINTSKTIKNLIIINLVLTAVLLGSKLFFLHRFLIIISKSFLVPLAAAVFLFYILRPLNHIFIKKGLKHGSAALLTLTVLAFVSSGLLYYFGNYLVAQFYNVVNNLSSIIEKSFTTNVFISKVNKFLLTNDFYKLLAAASKDYFQILGHSIASGLKYILNSFSKAFLIFVLLFYLLKDAHKLKEKLIPIVPEKFQHIILKIIRESDDVLSAYVTGQAKVALSLAVMIYISYKIIGLPNALLLSSTTFILGFIPFVGFFISMIIPILLSISIGLMMLVKLLIVFAIVQTLKGRVVVPAIMAKAMNIHPLTDIILVIGAISIGGPMSAFVIVPLYAILKESFLIIKKYK